MPGKYGSASLVLLYDALDLRAMKLKTVRYAVTAVTENITGVGDAWTEIMPVGLMQAEIAQTGGLFDTAAAGAHATLAAPDTNPHGSPHLISVAAAHEMGGPCVGFRGSLTTKYGVQGITGELTKANAEYVVVGAAEPGEIVQPLAAKTADWNTKDLGTPVDSGAGSANGAAGYLHVTAYTGFSSAVITIRHSSDDISYTDLMTFTVVTGLTAERVTVGGAVGRYLAVAGDVAGSGSLTCFVALARL
jgi:hypothetical protein